MAGSGGQEIEFENTAIQESLTTISISIWYQRTAGGGEFGYGRLTAKAPTAGSTSDSWQIFNDNGDGGFGLTFEYRRSGDDGWWSMAYPSNGVWHNLTITYDGSSTSNDPIFYHNGVSQTVTERRAPTGTLNTSTGELFVGVHPDGTEWDGPIAEAAIWNRVLTASEAAILGDAFSPAFILNGLVFYAPLIGRASPEPDLRGGTTGTVTGATNFAHPRIIYPSPAQMRRFTTATAVVVANPSWRSLTGVGL